MHQDEAFGTRNGVKTSLHLDLHKIDVKQEALYLQVVAKGDVITDLQAPATKFPSLPTSSFSF